MMTPSHPERWCVIPLSNWARAYDKYTGRYTKASLPKVSFPDRTFVLDAASLGVGVSKVRGWIARQGGGVGGAGLGGMADSGTGPARDIPVVLELDEDACPRRRDHASGVGAYIMAAAPRVRAVWWLDGDTLRAPAAPEEVWARSWAVVSPTLRPWGALVPRALSWLPVGHACQASCPFCFSKASVSEMYREAPLRFHDPGPVAARARAAGAVRAVITGGGEPTLLRQDLLLRGIGALAEHLGRVTLITNGHLLSRTAPGRRAETARAWKEAGLSVLALSHHAATPDRAAALMGLEVDAVGVVAAARQAGLTARWVCVLQRGGVEDGPTLDAYLDAAIAAGVEEINFKELYVSTPLESSWSAEPENLYAAAHGVPLSLVTDRAARDGWALVDRLPWGAPIYAARHRGAALRVAAYTEPTVHWERSRGIARSWNLMADGRVRASLEDAASEV